jgi:hypothetical protein
MTTAIGRARPFRESGNVHKWPASCWQNRSRGAAHQRFSGCRFSQRSLSKLGKIIKTEVRKAKVQRVRGYPRQRHASYPRECVRARARTRELQRFDPTCQSNPRLTQASDSRARALATGALRNTRRRSTTRLVYSTPPPYLLPINGQSLRVLFNINTCIFHKTLREALYSLYVWVRRVELVLPGILLSVPTVSSISVVAPR